MKTNSHNPDVLYSLANLSSDEVFTSPSIANQMLDTLPEEIWKDSNARFLDPFSKSGVFLREITKRLIKGLEEEIPDLQTRVDHIMKHQVFGISITELTSLVSRRSLYCSRLANGDKSITNAFDNADGNIAFERIEHSWDNRGRCVYCGANQKSLDRGDDLETYAYQFIHDDNPFSNMNFDVIIGNPPYQLDDGGAQASASPIYHLFIQQAKKLNPRYIVMITPARWYAGGKGLDSFREEMLNDDRIRVIHDFIRADNIFPGVEIKGGVSYFLWDRDNRGLCKVYTYIDEKVVSVSERPLLEEGASTFIRYNETIPIYRKVKAKKEKSISEIVSSRKPFGFPTNYRDFSSASFKGSIKLYGNKTIGYIEKEKIKRNIDWVSQHKVLIPVAIGVGNMKTDLLKPILAESDSCCTETYILLGPFETKKEAKNLISYINTKFFHLLLGLRKITQHTTKVIYEFVPMQDFNEEWTDEKLYKKYGLTEEEIEYIESMVRDME